MLASLIKFSFLCVIALVNLCLGFAIACRLGWGPSFATFFQLDQATPTGHSEQRDHELRGIDGEEAATVKRTADVEASDAVSPIAAGDPVAATAEAV